MGFRAHLFVWDWNKRCEILRHELHKVRVQDLCFSSDEQYIISLGGKDCGMIIVWNIEKKFVMIKVIKNLMAFVSVLLYVVRWLPGRQLGKLSL